MSLVHYHRFLFHQKIQFGWNMRFSSLYGPCIFCDQHLIIGLPKPFHLDVLQHAADDSFHSFLFVFFDFIYDVSLTLWLDLCQFAWHFSSERRCLLGYQFRCVFGDCSFSNNLLYCVGNIVFVREKNCSLSARLLLFVQICCPILPPNISAPDY